MPKPTDAEVWNILELAWAAGFFDGEGGTYGGERHGATIRVGQVEDNREVLERFHRAVLGIGRIRGPYPMRSGRPQSEWRVTSWPEVQAVIALLWRFLGSEKREQAKAVLARCTAPKRGWSGRMTYRRPRG